MSTPTIYSIPDLEDGNFIAIKDPTVEQQLAWAKASGNQRVVEEIEARKTLTGLSAKLRGNPRTSYITSREREQIADMLDILVETLA